MGKIHLLDQATINQIAAGEVIDRPVSVVKELLENAIDAGSTAVTVEIAQGGIDLIRVTDNGSGIDGEDMRIAFCRHSTSKISEAVDLQSVKSLGFRGEALSSIAAVSRVELITRTHTNMSGIRYVIEGGREVTMEEAGAPEGTTIIVRDLFFNTPARRKFLKTPATEGGYIYEMVCHIALSHPEVSFRFIQNGQSRLHTSGNHNLKDVIYNVYGKEVVKELVPFAYESAFFKVDGFLGKPVTARSNRNCEIYFINGRFIKSLLLRKAIEDAYRNFLMQHKFPFTVIQITIDSEFTDVNVHPSKMELRFRNQEYLYEELTGAIRKTLTETDLSVRAEFGSAIKKDSSAAKKDLLMGGQKGFNQKGTSNGREYSFLTGERKPGEEKSKEQKPTCQPVNVTGETVQSQTVTGVTGQAQAVAGETVQSQAVTGVTGQAQAVTGTTGQTQAVTGVTGQAQAVAGTTGQTQTVTKTAGQKTNGTEPVENRTFEETSEDYKPEESRTKQNQAEFTNLSKARPEPFETRRLQALIHEETAKYEEFQAGQMAQMNLFEDKLLSKDTVSDIRLVGQIFDTYWIASYKDTMLMIDQHAAHERVNYERILKELKERSFTTQQMNPPRIISLTPAEQAHFPQMNRILTECGFEIEPFGGAEYAVYGMPDNLVGISPEDFLYEILENAGENSSFTPEAIYEKAASLACKASIKGNQRISEQEAELLFAQLIDLENPYNCPHGRPVLIRMTKNEIEKKFKRIV